MARTAIAPNRERINCCAQTDGHLVVARNHEVTDKILVIACLAFVICALAEYAIAELGLR